MFAVVTGKVTEPVVPTVIVPTCAPTVTVFVGAADSVLNDAAALAPDAA